jgi:hypothetical protein
VKSTLHIFTAVILGFVCSGCLKLEHHITSPAARGVVLDARTRSPLSGAEVVVSRTQFWTNAPTVVDALTNTRPPVVTTGKSGRFRVPAEGHWQCVVDYLIAPLHKPGGTLVVQRAGYEPAAIPLWGDIAPIAAAQHTNFIEVLLSPVTK